MQEKFQAFEEEIRSREAPPAQPVSLRARSVSTAALLLSGFLLYRLPGSFPPPALAELLRLARAHELLPPGAHLVLLGQSAALCAACILWLWAAWRVLRMWRRPDPRLLLTQPPQVHPSEALEGLERTAPGEKGSEQEPGSALVAGTVPLERATGDPVQACLYTLVIDSSARARSRPALPAVLFGPGERGLVAGDEVREGIGLAVASCCHAGSGKRVAALEDATLSACGLWFWPEAEPPVLPVGLFLVADGGMVRVERGWYSTGYRAVGLLGQALLPLLSGAGTQDPDLVGRAIFGGIQQANAALGPAAEAARAAGGEVATALTAALVLGTTAYIANVGNCRTYFYRAGDGLRQMTFDHAGAAGGVDGGAPESPEQPVVGGQLYRSLGSAQEVEVDLVAIHLEVGDILLLCSDGFWERVERPLIEQTLQWFAGAPAADPFRLCSVLLERALERGAVDHLSITAVQVVRLPGDLEPEAGGATRSTARLSPTTGAG